MRRIVPFLLLGSSLGACPQNPPANPADGGDDRVTDTGPDTALPPPDGVVPDGAPTDTPAPDVPLAPGCTTLTCAAHAHCELRDTGPTCACDAGWQDRDGDGTCRENCLTAALTCPAGMHCDDRSGTAQCVAGSRPPIYISFHWHMHQPIYYPYESVVDSERMGRMGFPLYPIFTDRTGPYTTWPRDAIGAGRDLAHLGAQVSFSGSLMENLNSLAAAGVAFSGWAGAYTEAMGWTTMRGNPRLDLVSFGYHHPLMGLIDEADIRLQVLLHREAAMRAFGRRPGRGIFPPECAFSERMIPALSGEGIQWSLVDNIHFDRAHTGYTWRPESNLPPPNRADVTNSPMTGWVGLRDLWAPSPVSAPWGYQPHWVQYTDPATGRISRMIAVPAARYEGNEDARGGFGALQYERVLSQYESLNTDPAHPMLVVLHHDGDNYGGGTESYYHSNFAAFVAWVRSQPTRFVATTVQDYLDEFPPAAEDVIHVEDGSWSGADNGDPEFRKWNGAPGTDGYSPDRNSWSVITAVKNRVLTAESALAHGAIGDILAGTGNDTDRAWHWLLNAETSCYWYWDGQSVWDSNPTRAANQAAMFADRVLAGARDTVGPTMYLPQREPYNPGSGTMTTDFAVWTYAYDVSGLESVTLRYRVDPDGHRDAANETYAGGTWRDLPMTARTIAARTMPPPTYHADEYRVTVPGLSDVLVDYHVVARDRMGNEGRSPLLHAWVGRTTTPPVEMTWTPTAPRRADVITIQWNQAANLHWGVDASTNRNIWQVPAMEYWPAGTVPWTDGRSVESPLSGADGSTRYTIQLGPFNRTPVSEVNLVFHNASGTWSSPDQRIPIAP